MHLDLLIEIILNFGDKILTEDGKVTVNDPNFSHAGKSSKHYDFESISKQFKGYWSMTK